MEVREEHQDNTRGTRDVLASQTVTQCLLICELALISFNA
jgi:hypothetical protein